MDISRGWLDDLTGKFKDKEDFCEYISIYYLYTLYVHAEI